MIEVRLFATFRENRKKIDFLESSKVQTALEIVNYYEINPEEAVFLDDSEPNIKAARAYGLHGIHFKSYEEAKTELEKLLAE